MNRALRHILCALACLSLAACSTTKRLGRDEVLYTGIKKIEITTADSLPKIPADVLSDVRDPLSVKPNNPLWGARLRTPLPIGLWAYNAFYTEKEKGFKHWLYERFAKPPVLISNVQPDLRAGMVRDVLDNNGYFNSSATAEILPRGEKKAKVRYSVEVAPPWYYSRITYPEPTGPITRRIDSLRPGSLLHVGSRYDIDTLMNERVRITNALRNESYYYFRPDYLEYLADTTEARYRTDMRMILAKGTPEAALRPYRTGQVRVSLSNPLGGALDSMEINGIRVTYQTPLKIRPKVLQKSLFVRPGAPARLDSINATLDALTRLEIFRNVSLGVTPLDSLRGADSLDMFLSGTFDAPLQAEFEADFMSESNSFIGPGLIFGVKHKNLFGGGEVLGVHLNGSYEWQTGNSSSGANSSKVNSYEFGLTGSLSFQRLLLPRFLRRNEAPGSRTTFRLSSDLLQRPKYFTMLSLGASMGYEFKSSPRSTHKLNLVDFNFNDLLRTTSAFDSTMQANPAMALSFENQFIPASSYTYTYDRHTGLGNMNRFVWKTTFKPSGNLLAGIYALAGSTGTKKIAGNPFSQFVKGTTELKFYQHVGPKNTLVFRLYAGAGYAYGNSTVMPYSEQFYSGGSNSIRAFSSRSLGPGSYRAPEDDPTGYYDQTGDFKLEANIEFRFRIIGILSGALFVDAGNIWLLENDPERPGGQLTLGNFWKEIALGTGTGLRVDLGFLVVRGDLGIGIHTPYPNPDKPGYYNIPSFKDGLGFHLAIDYPF